MNGDGTDVAGCYACRWAYDNTKANLILDSGRNNLMQPSKRETLLAPGPAHSLEVVLSASPFVVLCLLLPSAFLRTEPTVAAQGYLFLLCAQYRRWQVPRAKNDLKVDVLMIIAILFACLAYAGYAVALARAVSGHLHLSMPGTLLLTGAPLLIVSGYAFLCIRTGPCVQVS